MKCSTNELLNEMMKAIEEEVTSEIVSQVEDVIYTKIHIKHIVRKHIEEKLRELTTGTILETMRENKELKSRINMIIQAESKYVKLIGRYQEKYGILS